MISKMAAEHGDLEVSVKKYVQRQSRSQQNLFWEWMEYMVKLRYDVTEVTERQKQKMHNLMCHKFLGTVEEEIEGEHVVTLRTLTYPERLDTGEMARFMTKIESWAAELGIYLPIPGSNEYSKYREATQ